MNQTAASCEWCPSAQAITDGSVIVGYECRHNAPRPLMVIGASDIVVTPQLVWPVLKSTDWCAQFTGKEK